MISGFCPLADQLAGQIASPSCGPTLGLGPTSGCGPPPWFGPTYRNRPQFSNLKTWSKLKPSTLKHEIHKKTPTGRCADPWNLESAGDASGGSHPRGSRETVIGNLQEIRPLRTANFPAKEKTSFLAPTTQETGNELIISGDNHCHWGAVHAFRSVQTP